MKSVSGRLHVLVSCLAALALTGCPVPGQQDSGPVTRIDVAQSDLGAILDRTTDGGYFLVGRDGKTQGSLHPFVIGLSPDRRVLWQHTFDDFFSTGRKHRRAIGLASRKGGGYLVGQTVENFLDPAIRPRVVRFDSDGTILWDIIPDVSDISIRAAAENEYGELFLFGIYSTRINDRNHTVSAFIRIAADGRLYAFVPFEDNPSPLVAPTAAISLDDGTIIVLATGDRYTSSVTSHRSDGKVNWIQYFRDLEATVVRQAPTGEIVVCGNREHRELVIIRLDQAGQVLSENEFAYGFEGYELNASEVRDLAIGADGNLALLTFFRVHRFPIPLLPFPVIVSEGLILRMFDPEGTPNSQTSRFVNATEKATDYWAIQPLDSGGYLLCGEIEWRDGNWDVYLTELDATGAIVGGTP